MILFDSKSKLLIWQGKGYGGEALLLLLKFGFYHLGMNRIWSAAVVENMPSRKSNDHVGMIEEGTLREPNVVEGHPGVVQVIADGLDLPEARLGARAQWQGVGRGTPIPMCSQTANYYLNHYQSYSTNEKTHLLTAVNFFHRRF